MSDTIDATSELAPPRRPAAGVRGAPPVPLHRNPTAWVLITTVALWILGGTAYVAWSAPWWVATPVMALATYLGFTVLHESVHRVAHRTRWVNDAMGWLPALALWFTLPVFRTCHAKHHANTNDPENDPDHTVGNMPAWLRVWWLLVTVVNYRRLYYGKGWWRTRGELVRQVALDALVVGLVVGAWVVGGAATLWALWIGPTLLAGLVLFYAFDYLPHRPHHVRGRYLDTRITLGRVRHWLLLGQSYHLVHHLWTTIPWYRYREVYEDLAEDLIARGATVDGLERAA